MSMKSTYNSSLSILLCSFFILSTFLITSVDAYFSFGQGHVYKEGDNVSSDKVQTVKLFSVQMPFPYRFYKYDTHVLPFAQPKGLDTDGDCNLGECLTGDRKQDSAYSFTVLKDVVCAVLPGYSEADLPHHEDDFDLLNELIKYDYRAQLTLDGLPIALNAGKKLEIGFPIGKIVNDTHYLYNHLNFTVGYQVISTDASGKDSSSSKDSSSDSKSKRDDHELKKVRIVQVTVIPHSRKYLDEKACNAAEFSPPLYNISGQTGDSLHKINWTYSVYWVQSNISYDERWDRYFYVEQTLHNVSLIYAIIVALALTIFLGVVLVRIVHSSPISKYNLDDVEESGWKTLHGDVFRPPHHFMILSVLVGGGAQTLASTLFVLLLGFIGVLSPVKSGSLTTGIAVIYPMMGFIGGYTSARIYATLGGGRKRRNAVFTAIGFNGIIFVLWFIAEIVLWSQHSTSGSVGAFFAIFALWLFVHTPLVFLGSFFAHKRPVGTNPTGTNTIPRMIPPAPWYSHIYLLTPLLAVLPYGVSFNSLYDVMDAMWSHHVYYYFGMVFVVFVLLTIIIAEVSVIMCYFQLANENYHWWWRAFYIPGAVVGYIFLTAIFFLGFDMHLIHGAPVFLYLVYTVIILLVLFVFMSSIAFYACWKFVFKIYSTLHVD